jgi:hypothetical protein
MTADPKLIERVMKLFALASGTTFAHEAASARAMAEALIAKHNLTLPSVKDRIAFGFVVYRPHFRGAKWEWMLADSVAAACGCDAFFDSEELSSFALVGTLADLEVCQYLLAILHEQRMRDWMRAKSAGAGVSDSFYSFCYSFARGVEANILARLTGQEIERTQRAHLWWEERVGGLTKFDLGIRGQGRSEIGRAAGESASLHRGNLGRGAEPKRLTHRR